MARAEPENNDSARIRKPIFILGPHRSGTTLLYGILGRHRDVAYLNLSNKRFPAWPRLAHFLTLMGGRADPMEAQAVWDRFRKADNDVMTAFEATPEVSLWYRNLANKVMELRGANRFLAKYPRLSLRIDWLETVFPGAIYIHMVRDWRAVVHSTVIRRVKREGREGDATWFGVRIPDWRELQDMPHEVASARIYRHISKVLEAAAARLGPRVVRFSYEELCVSPNESLRRLLSQLELEWSPEFEAAIPKDLRSSNYKWQKGLDPSLVARCREEDAGFYSRYEEEAILKGC